MSTAPEYGKRSTFKSYVAPPLLHNPSGIAVISDADEWRLPNDMRDLHLCQPRMLQGELIVASVPAHLYPTIAPIALDPDISNATSIAKDSAIFGLLTVTNFKLSFVPLLRQIINNSTTTTTAKIACSALESYQENAYLQLNEVTLNNIDHVVQLAEQTRASALTAGVSGRNRRKKLDSQQKVMNGRIAALHIICKNFRLLKFAFHQAKCGPDYGKQIASALAMFAFPTRNDLSFAYSYREPYYTTLQRSSAVGGTGTGITMYSTKNDWARELIRCGATEWQVISAENVPQLKHSSTTTSAANVQPRYTLPPHFVIPKCMAVDRFLDLSLAFCDSRAAFWVYEYGGASLVRLAELKPAAQHDSKAENIVLETVRGCNERRFLTLLQLTDRLPNVQDLQRSYQKFRRLCTPESPQQFMLQESKFLTLLEKSNWLFYVSLCLRYATEAAETLRTGTTCVLQESNGRDLCCIVSSLTQIILDPLFRSIDGFQSLVQKDWVALEHPFQRRLGHVLSPMGDDEIEPGMETGSVGASAGGGGGGESPVFLLFLDCVWQLLQQYPDEFEYTQTYLTTLWDSCFIPIFDTFQFDTEAQRRIAVQTKSLVLRPVWDWSEQFSDKDKMFFSNPLYQRARPEQNTRRSVALTGGGGGKNPVQLQQVNQVTGAAATAAAAQSHPTAHNQRATCIINPQLFVTQSMVARDRFLEPQYRTSALQIWEQCYYRWMPVLEIKNGGQPQIDLHHRILLSNITKLQRAIELNDFDDLPDIYYELMGVVRQKENNSNSNNDITDEAGGYADGEGGGNNETTTADDNIAFIDGVERRQKISTTYNRFNGLTGSNAGGGSHLRDLPDITSFFPFGLNLPETQHEQLNDILTDSNEFLLEGSIMDRLSMA